MAAVRPRWPLGATCDQGAGQKHTWNATHFPRPELRGRSHVGITSTGGGPSEVAASASSLLAPGGSGTGPPRRAERLGDTRIVEKRSIRSSASCCAAASRAAPARTTTSRATAALRRAMDAGKVDVGSDSLLCGVSQARARAAGLLAGRTVKHGTNSAFGVRFQVICDL